MYAHNLPDWPALEKQFEDAGYKLEIDLSNDFTIQHGDNIIDADELPENLFDLLNAFIEKHFDY